MTAEDMVFGVAQAHGLLVSDLRGPSRIARISAARHEAMWLIREGTELSFPDIGKLFGGRDHTTVLSAFRKIQERVDANPEYGRALRMKAVASNGGLKLQRLQKRVAALQAQSTILLKHIEAATEAVADGLAKAS